MHLSLPSLRSLAPLGVLLGSSPALAQSPPAPAFTGEQMAGIYSTAASIAASVQCPADASSGPNLADARTLAQAAVMLDVAARNYPPLAPRSDATSHAHKLAALILQATQVYEQAYRCAPGYDRRHHLEDARALIDARLLAIREVEKRTAEHRDYVTLATRRSELEQLMPAPPPPPPVDRERPEPRVPPPPPPPRSRYDRYAGMLVLRPQIGVGTGKLREIRDDRDENAIDDAITAAKADDDPNNNIEAIGDDTDRYGFTGFFFNLYAAVRFFSERHPHALLLGGTFNVQHTPGRAISPTAVFSSGLRLEGALHLHPRWASLHPALEVGVQTNAGNSTKGRVYVGPGLGLCLDRELACFNVRFSTPFATSGAPGAHLQLWQFGLGIDLMRIVDRARGVAKP